LCLVALPRCGADIFPNQWRRDQGLSDAASGRPEAGEDLIKPTVLIYQKLVATLLKVPLRSVPILAIRATAATEISDATRAYSIDVTP
jgi:hypothetical protein